MSLVVTCATNFPAAQVCDLAHRPIQNQRNFATPEHERFQGSSVPTSTVRNIEIQQALLLGKVSICPDSCISGLMGSFNGSACSLVGLLELFGHSFTE